jgi:hypothetical protein
VSVGGGGEGATKTQRDRQWKERWNDGCCVGGLLFE